MQYLNPKLPCNPMQIIHGDPRRLPLTRRARMWRWLRRHGVGLALVTVEAAMAGWLAIEWVRWLSE